MRPTVPLTDAEESASIRGVLRAVHLDQDWLEIATSDVPPQHVHIDEARHVLDDGIDPIVNRKALVSAIRRGQNHIYSDIELHDLSVIGRCPNLAVSPGFLPHLGF